MAQMTGWQPIETSPNKPMRVLYYAANAVWRDYHTDDVVDVPELHAMKFDIGYWDGATWREQGTNHEVFEFGDLNEEMLPTHWMPLPDPPKED